MLPNIEAFIQSLSKFIDFKTIGGIFSFLALLLILVRKKGSSKIVFFTGVRNLCIVLGIWFLTGNIRLIGFSDLVWLILAIIAGFIDGYLSSFIIPHNKKMLSNLPKLREWVSGLDSEKKNKLKKVIYGVLYSSSLSLFRHSLLIILITFITWFVIWTFGVVPYKHSASLVLIFLLVNTIRREWWNRWAWANSYVLSPISFINLGLPPVTPKTKLRLKNIVRFFYINIFFFLLFIFLFPKFLADESGLALLIQYFGIGGAVLFFGILIFLSLRFLGILGYSPAVDFVWKIGYLSLTSVVLCSFIAIFLNFLLEKSALVSTIIISFLLLILIFYSLKRLKGTLKRRTLFKVVYVYPLIFVLFFGIEMTPKFDFQRLLNIANKNLEMGFLKKANQELSELIKFPLLKSELFSSKMVLDTYLGLAESQLRLGNYASAKEHLKEIEAKKLMFSSNNHKLHLFLEIAKLYKELGDKDSSKRIMERAERILSEKEGYKTTLQRFFSFLSRPVNHIYWEAEIGIFKAKLLIVEKELAKGFELLNHVENIGKTLGSYHLIVDSKNVLGEVLFAQNKFEEAQKYFDSGLSLADRFKDRYRRAIFLINKARVQLNCGLIEKANDNFSLAIDIAKFIGAREIMWKGYYYKGLVAEKENDYAKALNFYKEAINIIESIRAELAVEKERTSFIGERIFPYERIVELFIEMHKRMPQLNYHKEALYYAERSKARTFFETLKAKEYLAKTAEDNEILKKEEGLLYKIINLRQKLIEKGNEKIREELEEAEMNYYNFLEEVKRKAPELSSIIGKFEFNIEEIQRNLQTNTSIIEYYSTEERIYIWLIKRNELKVFEIQKGKNYIETMVNKIFFPTIYGSRRIIHEQKPYSSMATLDSDYLRESYQNIFSIVEKDINTTNLIIVPHAALHKLPFSCLMDGNQYLIDKYNVSFLPCLSILNFIYQKNNTDNGKLLALSNPLVDYEKGFEELKFAEIEVSNISKWFKYYEIYYKQNATKKIIKDKASEFDVIHLACHGQFDEKFPLFSRLLLAGDKMSDGSLRVHEIFSLNLKNSNLVVLSACETALAKIEGGDDLVGLSRAFIYAGAPSLVGTLWSVNDLATAELMKNFYRNWREKKMSKSEALRKAQIALKSSPKWNDPYYWAPFVLIGDWK